jgi:DNA polymerase-3 subunit epsilon
MEKNSSAGMEYAIVDIETTGGNAASGGSITEIAIRIFDGNMVIDSFESLVKPNQRIPRLRMSSDQA